MHFVVNKLQDNFGALIYIIKLKQKQKILKLLFLFFNLFIIRLD